MTTYKKNSLSLPPCLPPPLFSFLSFKTQSGYVTQVGHKLRANPATSVSHLGLQMCTIMPRFFHFVFKVPFSDKSILILE